MTQPVILCGDCMTLVPAVTLPGLVDVLITDPPYSEHTHTHAVSCGPRGAKARDLGFAHLTDPLRDYVASAAAVARRWGVVYSDVEQAYRYRAAATAAGAGYIRTLAWIRWSMPQLSADRPCQGFEEIVITRGASPHGKGHWSGPGYLQHVEQDYPEQLGQVSAVDHTVLRGSSKHKTEKPLAQVLDLVHWFSDPGEVIFDPLTGSGVIPLACAMLGRACVAIEQEQIWATVAEARATAWCATRTLSARDNEQLARWRAALAARRAKLQPMITTAHRAGKISVQAERCMSAMQRDEELLHGTG